MPKLSAKEKKQHAKMRAAESRRDKFERLAVRRVNRAISAIRLLGNLSTGNYQWDLADVRYIRASINRAMEQTFTKFEAKKPATSADEFSFRSRRPVSGDAPTDWERWAEQVAERPARNQPAPQA